MKDLLSLNNLNRSEISILTDLSVEMKRSAQAKFKRSSHMAGKTLVCAAEDDFDFTAIALAYKYLGGNVFVTLNCADVVEYVKKVSNYGANLIAIRAKSQAAMESAAGSAACSVINAGTDESSPLETLARITTLKYCFDALEGKNIACVGNKNRALGRELISFLREEKANVFPFLPYEKTSFYPDEAVVYTQIELALSEADALVDLGVKSKKDYEDFYGSKEGLTDKLLAKAKSGIPLLGRRTLFSGGKESDYPFSQSDREEKDYLGACMAVFYYFFR